MYEHIYIVISRSSWENGVGDLKPDTHTHTQSRETQDRRCYILRGQYIYSAKQIVMLITTHAVGYNLNRYIRTVDKNGVWDCSRRFA